MRLRTRVLLAFATITLGVAAGLSWWLRASLADRVAAEQAEGLAHAARLLSATTAGEPFTDSLADRLGEQVGLRVTLIDPEGVVLGDSEVPPSRLPELENHAGRPEVRAALREGSGAALRSSRTVDRPLLYAAVRDPRGVLRVSRSAAGVEAVLSDARRGILVAGAAGLLLAALAAGWLERDARRRLAGVAGAIRDLEDGRLASRPPTGGEDEAARLGTAVVETAGVLEERFRALESERGELEALFRSLSDGLAVIGPSGEVQQANAAFRDWAGRDDVTGLRFGSLFRSPPLVDAVRLAMEGRQETREVELGERTLLASVQPYEGGALVVLRDLTRLRKLEGVRRDFVANVSHELKTPLTSMVGFAEAIAGGGLPEERSREFAERILANAMRMRRLVDDLLDLSMVESGSWQAEPEPVELVSAARSVWRQVASQADRRGVELSVEVADGSLVHADPEAVRQILRNLLDNALRYAPEDSRVEVSIREQGPMVEVRVADRGPGIPSVHRERVFERFYRADPARSREAGGTGLGLSIVKHLVLAHGGQVGIESEVGVGTTVRFTLPAAETPGAEGPPPAPGAPA